MLAVTWQMLATNLFHYIHGYPFPSIRLTLKYLQEWALLSLPVVSVHLALRMLIQERVRARGTGGT
jgi:hypothetical protein